MEGVVDQESGGQQPRMKELSLGSHLRPLQLGLCRLTLMPAECNKNSSLSFSWQERIILARGWGWSRELPEQWDWYCMLFLCPTLILGHQLSMDRDVLTSFSYP